MGSLENNNSNYNNIKKNASFSKQNRDRSRIPRLFFSKRLNYLQWISTIIVFSLLLVVFQAFLPGSLEEKSGISSKNLGLNEGDFVYLKNVIDEVNLWDDLKFGPTKLLAKFKKEAVELNQSFVSEKRIRFGFRKPKLALVFADLALDRYQILMSTLATALQEIGYSIEVFSNEDGPSRALWIRMGIPVTVVEGKDYSRTENPIDWLNYDGVLLNSLEGKAVLSCFMVEPFKSLPVIWTIHERTLATRLSQNTSNWTADMLNDWKKSFSRASVVVFPNNALSMMYSTLDTGNYFVIPGTPTEALEADNSISINKEQLQAKMGLADDDFVVAVVGSQFMYKGLWLEHALILQALKPLLTDFSSDVSSNSGLKIIILTEDSTGNYTKAVEAISASLEYPAGVVKHADRDANADYVLRTANLVLYGSFLEEQSFPDILIQAMRYEKLIIAPDLSMIRKYVDDRVNGFLFPKESVKVLSEIISEVVSRGKLSPLAHNVASIGKETSRNFMVGEVIEGYAFLLENMLKLSSEVAASKPVTEIPSKYKNEWQRNISNIIPDSIFKNRDLSSNVFLDKIQQQSNNPEPSVSTSIKDDEFMYSIWEEQKQVNIASEIKAREDQELKDRSEHAHGTWEDVYRSSKRAERSKNELHERDDGELERTGQPLCIYEPYLGEGSWPFLHHKSLYRGVGLASRGRRKGLDDIDASSRLPLLSNSYYRDVLGEFGAFFAIANHIDRIHKNSWIGFQSWRATGRKVALSSRAEKAMLEAIEARKHGDAFFFWVRMDKDPRNPLNLDFWSFCDAVNAGNCRSAFSNAFEKMYGIDNDRDFLPPMPLDSDTWSVMHSWALPTRSFLEFVMFARMFVDALDNQIYAHHHLTGHCFLSLSKDKQCYTRVLELLINVWAYHSARHMLYVNPETGVMQEQHKLENRKGKMWIKWFNFPTLKSMDEDLAEEADSDNKRRRWLWPSTGEVVWKGVLEKERDQKKKEIAEKKKKSREKLARIRRRNAHNHKPLGKYVKPPPEEMVNTTSAVVRR
ncbi:hypothetical protein RND81_02G127100 [Saponaria officinalis]|uniref:Glycosyl transferase family 1 domain-containing protein n=1 Tax=Saponaria officinalis TaxID=3572 RepID=A0AAW1MPM8_SAPOF